MSPLIALFRKDLRRFLNDRRALAVHITLPFLLTLIMGLSFGGGIFGGGGGISAIPLDLVGGDLPEMLQESLSEGLHESGFFTVTWTDSLTADARVRRGESVAAVVLPATLLEDCLAFRPIRIQLWKDPNSHLKAGIVQQILERGLRQYQAGEAAYLALWPEDQEPYRSPAEERKVQNLLAGDFTTLWRSWRDDPDDENWTRARERITRGVDRFVALEGALRRPVLSLEVHDKAPAAAAESGNKVNFFNYFLPSFSVFFLMFAVAASARDLHREKGTGTLQRQLLGPAGRRDLLLGKWLAATVQSMVMLVVLYLAGALAFQVNLGPDLFALPLMVFFCCAAAAAFFIFLAQLVSSEKIMDNPAFFPRGGPGGLQLLGQPGVQRHHGPQPDPVRKPRSRAGAAGDDGGLHPAESDAGAVASP